MTTYTPKLVIISLLLAAPALAQAKEDGLPEKYEFVIEKTATEPAIIKEILGNSMTCAPGPYKAQVQASVNKTKAQSEENQKQLKADRDRLAKADAAIKAEISEKLKGFKPNMEGIDMCQGENETIKTMYTDLKTKAKDAAEKKIKEIATKVNDGIKLLKTNTQAQINKNLADRPSDLSGLSKAQMLPFRDAENAACGKVSAALQRGDAEKPLKEYMSQLDSMEKAVPKWSEQKKTESNTQIDAEVEKMQGFTLAKKTCGEKPAADAKKPSSKDSTVSEAEKKPAAKQAEKPASVAKDSATSAKDNSQLPNPDKVKERPAFSSDAGKPAANSEPAPQSQTEAAPRISKADGSHNVNDVAYGTLNDTAPIASVTQTPVEAATATTQEPLTASATAQAAPLARAEGTESSAASSFGQGTTKYNNYGSSAYSAAEENNLGAETNRQLSAAATAAPTVNPNDPYPVQPLDDAPQRGVVDNTDGYGNDTPKANMPEPVASATEDKSLTQSLRSSYQSDEIFTKRDLDFNSKKDASIIQRALNQVPGPDGRTPTSQLTTDGVFGTRSTARLDEVMQNPVQKAAFLKALRAQMK